MIDWWYKTMKNKKKIEPFYKIVSDLLKIKIRTIEDFKKFFIRINNLASYIAGEPYLANILKNIISNDNEKLSEDVAHILGYGEVVQESDFLLKFPSKYTIQKLKKRSYFYTNKKFKSKIENVKKVATGSLKGLNNSNDIYFKKILQIVHLSQESINAIAKAMRGAETEQKKIEIIYKMGIGQLIINGNTIAVSGKQKDALDCLIENGDSLRTSWDEIFEKFGDQNDYTNDVKKRSVRTAIKSINEKTKQFLKTGMDFIGAKENEYWFQYEVTKGR